MTRQPSTRKTSAGPSFGRTLAATCLGLCVISCDNTLPVIESPPPPPPRAPSDAPKPFAGSPPGRTIGSLPQMPVPRFAVSIFAFPPSGPGADAVYSPERSATVATRFDLNHVTANPLAQTGTLTGDLEQATAPLAMDPSAKVADILLAGAIQPGGNTQVRLFARDTRDGRLVARSEFEGESSAVLARAVDDAFQQVNRYWFELARGQLSQVRVEVSGLRADSEIGLLQNAMAALSGVRLVRHEETRVEGETAWAAYRLTLEGASEAIGEGLAKLSWPSASNTAGESSGKAAHLERLDVPGGHFVFRALYD